METQAVIEAGTRRGVPIRILRVIGDTYEDDLTPLLGSGQPFSIWRIALRLLNPRAWPLALRLRRQSQVASGKLVQALAATDNLAADSLWLITRAAQTPKQADRAKLYEQAQVIFKDEAPWITVAHSVRFDPVRKEVKGYQMDATAHHYFDRTEIVK